MAIALAFMVQVDLAEAARTVHADEDPMPTSGLLSCFYDAYDRPWGLEPGDRQDFRVIYSGPPRAEAAWRAPTRDPR